MASTMSINFCKTHKVTFSLLVILVIVHAFMTLNPKYLYRIAGYEIINREIISCFIHLDFGHLLLNSLSLHSLYVVEERHGSKKYLCTIIYFILMNACLIESLNRFYQTSFVIGFSGVIFGLFTLYPFNNIYGWMCDPKYFVGIMLAITHILFRNSSLSGHLAGIFAGGIYMTIRDMKDFRITK